VLVKFRQTVRNIGCLINPMAALIDRATLPRPITRRMRQRAFVILNPCQIAGIKSSAALVAAEIVLALVERRSTDMHANPAPARSRLIHRHDRGHVHLSKKSAPVSRGRFSYGARRTSGHAAIVVLYRHGDRRCQTCRPSRSPCPCVLPGRVRTCQCRL
jgi:hypothetical protein